MNIIFQNQFFILFGLLIIFSAIFLWQIMQVRKKLRPLFQTVEPRDELELKQDIIRRLMRLEAKNEELEPRLELVEKISRISVQKVGFARFNPFQDTGGDNSFIAVFLDHNNHGLLISSLYSREGVRLYAKQIEKGISKHHISEEEKKVLEDTIQKSQ